MLEHLNPKKVLRAKILMQNVLRRQIPPRNHRIRIRNRRATLVGAFEVFEAAHVVSRRPEIDRSNNSQPVKASQFVRDLYYRMVIWLNKSGFFRERTIRISNYGRWLQTEG